MTDAEINSFIKANYKEMTDKKLSECVKLSLAVISKRRKRMGLKSPNRSYVLYSLPVLPIAAYCYELWVEGKNTDYICKEVGVSACTVLKYISKFLPIKKGDGITITIQSKINT